MHVKHVVTLQGIAFEIGTCHYCSCEIKNSELKMLDRSPDYEDVSLSYFMITICGSTYSLDLRSRNFVFLILCNFLRTCSKTGSGMSFSSLLVLESNICNLTFINDNTILDLLKCSLASSRNHLIK